MWMDDWLLWQRFEDWPLLQGAQHDYERFLFRFFAVENTAVVLANSNKQETEVNSRYCAEHHIPILRRRGGGGTVCLTPGCVVFTCGFYAKDLFSNQKYFSAINQLWIAALRTLGDFAIVEKGISDLAVAHQKIAGTSLFRRKHLVVYQGSLLVHPDFKLVSQSLCHPSQEPDYRQGRSHEDFLTSLRAHGFQGTAANVAASCQSFVQQHAHDFLKEHLGTGPEKTFFDF